MLKLLLFLFSGYQEGLDKIIFIESIEYQEVLSKKVMVNYDVREYCVIIFFRDYGFLGMYGEIIMFVI